MFEVTESRDGHAHVVLLAVVDGILVVDRAAGMCHSHNAGLVGYLHTVGKGEEGVACHHCAMQVEAEALCHPEKVRAKAYDFVCNGVELGGGSLRIHDGKLQAKMFDILGFTPERAMAQFGFLINAFKYGAPPHAGLAFGLDRFVSIMAGLDSIRDCIAFPKNNNGRDVMLDAPGELDPKQLEELQLKLNLKEE